MTETPAASSAFPGQRAAIRLGLALLAGLGLALALVLRDNARRSSLEIVVRSTAVGDRQYFQPPAEPWRENLPSVVSLNGQPLFLAGSKRFGKPELEMEIVATDAATGLTIYRVRRKAKAGDEKKSEPFYFVKSGPSEFLKVQPADAGK